MQKAEIYLTVTAWACGMPEQSWPEEVRERAETLGIRLCDNDVMAGLIFK